MNILITCFTLRNRTGMELYTRDLAVELKRRGHSPAVFASTLGPVADEICAAGIPVTTRLDSLPFPPDIIHGNYHRTTLAAVLHFPSVPALFVCHAHAGWVGSAPIHPRNVCYFGVSRLCVERLVAQGVPSDRVELSLNSVDTSKFLPRPPLPARPGRALLFSNYARASTQLIPVTEACHKAGIQLDVVGAGVANLAAKPEEILGKYDIVFAKAKAAMEAMAVGCEVVLCDFGGVGSIVTSADFERLRPLNFGFEALNKPLTAESLLTEIKRYDARDAGIVRDLVRSKCSLELAVENLLTTYQSVIAAHRLCPQLDVASHSNNFRKTLLRDGLLERMLTIWMTVPLNCQDRLCSLPGINGVRSQLVRSLFATKSPPAAAAASSSPGKRASTQPR